MSPSKDSRQIACTSDSEPKLTADSTNLWAQAEQTLRANPKTKKILDEATQILEEFGLKIESEHQQLCSFLDDRVAEIEEKKWMIHYREVSGQDLLTTIFQNVLKVKDIVNAAASACPPAAIACAGVTVCLVLFIQGVEQHKALLKGLDTTAALIPRLCMMETLYLNSQSGTKLTAEFTKDFKKGFMILLGKILEFQARALCYLQRGSFTRRRRDMLQQDPWNALVQDMTSLESESDKFTALINAAENKTERERREHELENALQSYKTWQTSSNRDERVKKFLRELYKYTCPYKERKDRNNKHVPETCEWFTQHKRFQDWDQSQESCLLWVSADPGCGKSVLAKYLVDEVLPRPRKRKVCYFFFKDDFSDQKSSTSALCAVIRNLLLSQPSLLSDHILNKVDTDGDKLFQSFDDLWEILLEVTTNPHAGEVICVIDALDECQDYDRDQLIRAVRKFYLRSDSERVLKFLMTSRPYDQIRRLFQNLEYRMPMIHLSGENEDEVEKISHEIDLVITSRVHEISRQKSLECAEREFLQQQLTSIPNRTYLWVTLTLDFIENTQGFTKGHVHRVINHQIPRTVDEAYDKILNRSSDRDKARKLLHIVTTSMRPLSVIEVSLALAVTPESQSYDKIKDEMEPVERFKYSLRQICGLILTVIDNKVYLLHQTVKEFLVWKELPLNYSPPDNSWKNTFVSSHSNGVMAEICMRYLLADLDETDLNTLRQYSAKFWPYHLCEADDYEQEKLGVLTCSLCEVKSKIFKSWVEVWEQTSEEMHEILSGPQSNTPLMVASSLGLRAVVRRLLEYEDVDIESKGYNGMTALLLAAKNGHGVVVKLLLDTGKVDVGIKNIYNRTPLLYAAQNGHVAVVKLLLDTGKVDVDTKDDFEKTPLVYAARNGHEAVVKLLLDNGKVDVNTKVDYNETPLLYAARNGHEAVVKLLLDNGKVDVDNKNDGNRTPLSYAARNGHVAVVKLLLDTGKVDVNIKDAKDETPLSWAKKNGYEAIVRLLENSCIEK